ncbi:MAG: SDR family oxidoreductase [Patescibacteria group bacterium]|nr:SDR family oxidoreductase [Patescibacteria group bacterium]MCL5095209.1 SDR family oxidoreductase [Patescibacteria group bacterium]
MAKDKTSILGTGLTGLVGSRIVELLEKKYEFENLSYETGIDITNKEQVKNAVFASKAKIILHFAAKTDVDACEKDRELKNQGSAWLINVEGTRNLLEAAQKTKKKFIYISTDFVFDGNKDFYQEEDMPNPINWYAVTKYEGEKIVQSSGLPYLICRLAFPYRANFAPKKDLVRGLLEKLKNHEELKMVSDQFMTPTFIDDIAIAIDCLIAKEAEGIFHVVGSSFHTPFEVAQLLAETFSLDKSLIKEIDRITYYQNKAPRPFSLRLKNDKLKKLKVEMLTLKQGLMVLKGQRR